jgi:hypothetical protein
LQRDAVQHLASATNDPQMLDFDRRVSHLVAQAIG